MALITSGLGVGVRFQARTGVDCAATANCQWRPDDSTGQLKCGGEKLRELQLTAAIPMENPY